VKRKKANAPQVMKMSCPQAFQVSEDHEQKFEKDQLDDVHGLSQRWASQSTHED
jgi:hypothetical protein